MLESIELGQFWRDVTFESVACESYLMDAPLEGCSDSEPFTQRLVAKPIVVACPLVSVGCVVERDQRA